MKLLKRLLWILLLAFVGIVLAGIYLLFIEPKIIRLEGDIPQIEIVFRQRKDGITSLGFINADGSGYEERKVGRISGWVTWSAGGNYLNLRLMPMLYAVPGGTAFMISKDGHVHYCSALERDGTTLNFRSSDDLKILLVKDDEGPNPEKVVVFDMKACQEGETLYTAKPGESIGEVDRSSQKILAVHISMPFQPWGVSILDPQGKELRYITDAEKPVWSKDGEWLAYTLPMKGGSMQLAISKKDGSSQKELGVITGCTPAWSPDGEWLLYERGGRIYKLSVKTGEEIKLIDNGFSPDWRKIP